MYFSELACLRVKCARLSVFISVGGHMWVLCRINNLNGLTSEEDPVQTWLKLLAAASEREANMRRRWVSGCIGEKGHIMQKEKEDFLQCTHMIIWCDQLLVFQCWLGFLFLHFCDVVMRARVHGVINRVHHRPLSSLKWLHKPLRDHRTFTWEADCPVFTLNTHAYTQTLKMLRWNYGNSIISLWVYSVWFICDVRGSAILLMHQKTKKLQSSCCFGCLAALLAAIYTSEDTLLSIQSMYDGCDFRTKWLITKVWHFQNCF